MPKSKLDYLSKYTDGGGSGDDDRRSKKKKKKHKSKRKESTTVYLNDYEDDFASRHNVSDPGMQDLLDEEEDRPIVVSAADLPISNDAPATTNVGGGWETVPLHADGQSSPHVDGPSMNRRRRHDSSDEEDNADSHRRPRRRRRHDSSDEEGSDQPARRSRRHDSSDEEDNGGSNRRARRHDSSDQESNNEPRRRPRRHDSSDEEDTGKSAARPQRHDSSDDNDSAVRKPRRRHDSSDEESETPPTSHKRRRHDSEDEEADKVSSMDTTTSRRRRYDSSDEEQEDSKRPARMSSGHRAGLQNYKDFQKAEGKIQEQKKQTAQAMVDQYGMGETVYRDKDGKKQESTDPAAKVSLTDQQQKELNQGKVQRQAAEDREREFQMLQESAFARHRGDDRLEDMLKDQIREGDPMASYAAKKSTSSHKRKHGSSGSAVPLRPQKPVYKGPPAKPNRFGIRPGYRWDGVDRGNGFEDKLLAQKYSSNIREEEAYRWRSKDM
eukprot:Nitzschia sp. Nitz4//scaffold7_size249615//233262//234746//NITZ4_001218-RA/size249615-processed-gene-0.215-mRNA-1//-1//CDS//3329558565//3747//frame0